MPDVSLWWVLVGAVILLLVCWRVVKDVMESGRCIGFSQGREAVRTPPSTAVQDELIQERQKRLQRVYGYLVRRSYQARRHMTAAEDREAQDELQLWRDMDGAVRYVRRRVYVLLQLRHWTSRELEEADEICEDWEHV